MYVQSVGPSVMREKPHLQRQLDQAISLKSAKLRIYNSATKQGCLLV